MSNPHHRKFAYYLPFDLYVMTLRGVRPGRVIGPPLAEALEALNVGLLF